MYRYSALPDRILAYQLYEDYLYGATYRFFLNDEFQGETKVTDFTFAHLFPGLAYRIGIEVWKDGKLVRKEEKEVATSSVKKTIRLQPVEGEGQSTKLLQEAFDASKEGEEIVLSKGVYRCGALFLHSHTCLKLEAGAKILGSSNPDDYPELPSRFEGIEMDCYASLINVGKMDHSSSPTTFDVCIYGEGTIEGGGNPLANAVIDRHKGECEGKELSKELEAGRRRGRLIQFNNVDGMILEGLKLGNSPSWNIHAIYSRNLVTANCSFFSRGILNGDGWDPDSSEHCYLFHCHFAVGDDCVAIKSGKNPQGNLIARPCVDIEVFDSDCEFGHALAIGSEMSGGVSKVRFFDNNFIRTIWGVQIKGTKKRGGYVKDFIAKNSSFGCIKVWSVPYNDDGVAAKEPPIFSDIHFEDILLDGFRYNPDGTSEEVSPIIVSGFAEEPERFSDITFSHIRCLREGTKNVFEHAVNVSMDGKTLL